MKLFAINRSVVGSTLILTTFLALAWLAQSPPVHALSFVMSMGIAWLAYALFFASQELPLFALRWATACAIAVRMAGIWSHPVYEDDWARYLWDGFRFLADGTPYGAPPFSYFEKASVAPAWRVVLAQINNPEIPTIYAPSLQYVFAASAWIAPTSLTALKSLFVIFDLGLWALVARLGGYRAGLRYALCPLVIFEISFNAHADVVGAFLTVASFSLLRKGRSIGSGLAFGLALACKPFAIIIAPSFVRSRWCLVSLGAGTALVALYAPFILTGATEQAGLQQFAQWFEFNSLGFAVLKELAGDAAARILGLALGCALSGALMLRWLYRERDTFPPADIWLIALLLFAPVINPWYFLWAVPWASLRPNPISWSIFPAISLAYLTAGIIGIADHGFYDHPAWVRPLEVFTASAIYLSAAWVVPLVRTRRLGKTEI
ncbi:hypothetical protein [Hyphomicrobium sp. 2TAF46]|uniref:hypothetical protein n=1 Tax=Hyphomicrobium sp. 2TAF46 TaxID=3233019 RepID=UPI003F8E66D5